MFYQGKSGKFWIYADRVCLPQSVLAEHAEDFVQDMVQAFQLMHDMQDKLNKEKEEMN